MPHKVCVFLVSLTCMSAGVGCSYTWDLPVLSRQQAIHDLEFLVTKVKAIHPDPWTRVSEEEFDAKVEQIEAGLADKIKRNDFALPLLELLALMRDSHTTVDVLIPYQTFLREGGKVFPLELRYDDGDAKVLAITKQLKPKQLKVGDTVVAINAQPIESLLGQYWKYIAAETEDQKHWMLARVAPLLLWHSEGEVDSFEITARDAQGQRYTEQLEAMPPEFEENKGLPSASKEPYSFDFYKDDQICLLRAPSFNWGYHKEFTKTLKDMIAQMKDKKTSILIVDIRHNGGGHGGLPHELLRRTAQKPFATGSARRWRYSRAYQEACLIHGLKKKGVPAWLCLEKWMRLEDYLPVDFSAYEVQGEYRILESSDKTRPRKNHWRGKLALMIDHQTASAATWLAAIVKDNQLGLIAGEETGGRASYFADIAPVYLPYSGLRCVISSAHTMRPAGYDDGRGVLPDLPLDVSLEDSVLVETIHNHVRTQ